MQNSLDRLFDGIAATLRDVVLPDLTDPYARSQVRAGIELLGNLAERVEWRRDQLETVVERVRRALDAVGSPSPALTGDPIEDRRSHLAALAEAARVDELQPPIREALLEDLAEELDRLRTGMYR